MGRTFALSDLHGQWGLWQQIKQFLNQDDKLYFLGDAIDRGPKGYEIMKELLCDSRVTYIMGINVFNLFFKDERPTVSIWQVEADLRSASNASRLINEFIKKYGGQQVHTHEEKKVSSNAKFRFNTGRGPVEIFDDRIVYNKKIYRYEELESAAYVIGTQVFTLTFKDKRPPELIWLIRVDIKTGKSVNEFTKERIAACS